MGRSYKQLIADWRDVLPTQSICLNVPIIWPSEYHDRIALRQKREAHQMRAGELVVEAQG